MHIGFWWGNVKETDALKYADLGEGIILNWMECYCVNCYQLAEDRDKRWAVVGMVMNFVGNVLSS